MRVRSVLACGLLFGCSASEESVEPVSTPAESDGPRVVLLVSMEAARADSLECYADSDHWAYYVTTEMQRLGVPAARIASQQQRFPHASTETICGLAETGVRFRWALSHAPSTLSSHVSMMSGMDPHRHRVSGDGHPVSDEIPLLAERMQSSGWDTIGVVATDALASSMGLNRGFRRYVDPVSLPVDGAPVISALEVNRRVLAEIDSRASEEDLFLFVEYADAQFPWFDAAAPEYFAPELFRDEFVEARYTGNLNGDIESIDRARRTRAQGQLTITDSIRARGLYLSQVSWIDQQFGQLLEGLEERGLMQDVLVVVTADHGMTLDELTAMSYSHGFQTDLRSLHVPLVVHGRGSLGMENTGITFDPVIRLMDLPSTILAAAGIAEAHGDGQDFGALWRGERYAARPHLAEATSGQLARQGSWSNLLFPQALIRDGFVLQRWYGVTDGQIREQHMLHRLAVGQPPIPLNGPDGAAAQVTLQSLAATLARWNEGVPAASNSTGNQETPTP